MRSSIIVSTIVLGAFASPRASFTNVLERRQSSSNPYPSQCNGPCSSVESALNSCSDDKCFCTTTNIQNFAQCLQCTVNILGDVEDFQSTLTEVVGDCNSEGFKVPSETLTGGSGGSVPTGGSSPTGTFFSSPAGPTSDPFGPSSGPSFPTGNTSVGGLNPTPTNQVPSTPTNTPASGGNNNGNGLPSLGGASPGGALGMGVPYAFVGTILAGLGLAIAAL